MPPLKILNDKFFLVSPLDIQVYVFQIPPVKEDQRKEEIRKRLRILYPGNHQDALIDYRLFKKENQAGFTVTAFVCPKAVSDSCQKIKAPLIPGISLINLGARKLTGLEKTVILFTSQWIELARFKGMELVRYTACGRDFLSFTASFCGEGGVKETALLINAEPASGKGEDIQKMLEGKFASLELLTVTDLEIKKHLKASRIFHNRNRYRIMNRKRLIHALIVLNGVFLALALSFAASKLNLRLQSLQKVQEEQKTYQEEGRRLEKEISGLRSRLPDLSMYELLSEIQSSIPNGRIRSLTIQDGDLSLEAEGTDSLSAFNNLQNSSYFSDLLIQQAVPSAHNEERFTVSGKVRYEKE